MGKFDVFEDIKVDVEMEYHDLPSEDFTGVASFAIYEQYGGAKFFYLNGKEHREFGPACVFGDWLESYALDGIAYEKKAYWKEMYNRYKGTDKEELCLAYLLGAD